MNKSKDLRCLMCRKDPTLKNILIIKIDNNNWIDSSLCTRCYKKTEYSSLQKQGWIIVGELKDLFFFEKD